MSRSVFLLYHVPDQMAALYGKLQLSEIAGGASVDRFKNPIKILNVGKPRLTGTFRHAFIGKNQQILRFRYPNQIQIIGEGFAGGLLKYFTEVDGVEI